eukprot:TRINITY_DN11873_c0_g1_i1.p1 TRINITY_DN11873_c0_g1~~TRINITY_DN11873_c0_g1_i1.p1  ORF type:complete len:161 (-),score=10.75 TRINITY_DN11873_c0_g1_i1:65-547(-)
MSWFGGKSDEIDLAEIFMEEPDEELTDELTREITDWAASLEVRAEYELAVMAEKVQILDKCSKQYTAPSPSASEAVKREYSTKVLGCVIPELCKEEWKNLAACKPRKGVECKEQKRALHLCYGKFMMRLSFLDQLMRQQQSRMSTHSTETGTPVMRPRPV